MEEVDALTVDLGDGRLELVETPLLRALVEGVLPVREQRLEILAFRSHLPTDSRELVGQTCARQTVAQVGELRFGNIVARDLDAVVAPGLGEANVLGMNLLSRLASWRVEGRTLILVPNHPQPVPEI